MCPWLSWQCCPTDTKTLFFPHSLFSPISCIFFATKSIPSSSYLHYTYLFISQHGGGCTLALGLSSLSLSRYFKDSGNSINLCWFWYLLIFFNSLHMDVKFFSLILLMLTYILQYNLDFHTMKDVLYEIKCTIFIPDISLLCFWPFHTTVFTCANNATIYIPHVIVDTFYTLFHLLNFIFHFLYLSHYYWQIKL